jgi:carbonic anhydrase
MVAAYSNVVITGMTYHNSMLPIMDFQIGPGQWKDFYPACGGRRQSPIDVVPSISTAETVYPEFSFVNLDVFHQNVTVEHNGHTGMC